eukprot:tig00000754_g3900.t1
MAAFVVPGLARPQAAPSTLHAHERVCRAPPLQPEHPQSARSTSRFEALGARRRGFLGSRNGSSIFGCRVMLRDQASPCGRRDPVAVTAQAGSPPSSSEPCRIAVLISGGGRSLENLCERIDDGSVPAEVAVVISSREDAYGLVRAQKRNIPTHVVNRKEYKSGEEYSEAITRLVDASGCNLVVLAGFLSLYRVPRHLENRVINIHPALIPKYCGKGFYGHHVHEAVLAGNETVSGCTVHFCDLEYDNGPIILRKEVPVLPGDDAEALAARVFEAEKEALPEAVRLFALGRLRVTGARDVEILP